MFGVSHDMKWLQEEAAAQAAMARHALLMERQGERQRQQVGTRRINRDLFGIASWDHESGFTLARATYPVRLGPASHGPREPRIAHATDGKSQLMQTLPQTKAWASHGANLTCFCET